MTDQVVDRLLDGLAGGSHGDDHALGLRVADIIEGPVASAGQVAYLLHSGVDDRRDFKVIRVGGLAALKVDIGILGRAPQLRPLGVDAPRPEFGHGAEVRQPAHVLVVDDGDFLNFMRGAKPVEKVHKGYARLDGCKMRHQTEVHHFLDRRRGDHRKPRLAGGHDVLVIAENG